MLLVTSTYIISSSMSFKNRRICISIEASRRQFGPKTFQLRRPIRIAPYSNLLQVFLWNFATWLIPFLSKHSPFFVENFFCVKQFQENGMSELRVLEPKQRNTKQPVMNLQVLEAVNICFLHGFNSLLVFNHVQSVSVAYVKVDVSITRGRCNVHRILAYFSFDQFLRCGNLWQCQTMQPTCCFVFSQTKP